MPKPKIVGGGGPVEHNTSINPVLLQHSEVEQTREEKKIEANFNVVLDASPKLSEKMIQPLHGHDIRLCDVFTEEECLRLLEEAERVGGYGKTNYPKHYRGNLRLITTDFGLAESVFARIAKHLPDTVEEQGKIWRLCGLNECWRLAKYHPGDCFSNHCDAYFQRIITKEEEQKEEGGDEDEQEDENCDKGKGEGGYRHGNDTNKNQILETRAPQKEEHKKEEDQDQEQGMRKTTLDEKKQRLGKDEKQGKAIRHSTKPKEVVQKSMYTVNIYMNGGFEGGETVFTKEDMKTPILTVQPKAGLCLIFRQPRHTYLYHLGETLKSGRKVLFRSDVMYERDAVR